MKLRAPSGPNARPGCDGSIEVTQSLDPEVLHILDGAARLTLATFLVLFAGVGLYNFYSFNSRRLTGTLHPEEMDLHQPWQILRPLLSSLVFSSLLALLSFFFYAFVPAPFLDNYATAGGWKRAAVRITSLQFDRFHEGFSLKGEIWNQKEEDLVGMQVVVSVLDHNKEPLARLVVAPVPPTMKSGQTAAFEVRYAENSTLIHGYQLAFQDSDGAPIDHVAGFDVE